MSLKWGLFARGATFSGSCCRKRRVFQKLCKSPRWHWLHWIDDREGRFWKQSGQGVQIRGSAGIMWKQSKEENMCITNMVAYIVNIIMFFLDHFKRLSRGHLHNHIYFFLKSINICIFIQKSQQREVFLTEDWTSLPSKNVTSRIFFQNNVQATVKGGQQELLVKPIRLFLSLHTFSFILNCLFFH